MLSFMTSFMMTTKWATDQSAIRTWPCMNIVIFTHNLGNWLILTASNVLSISCQEFWSQSVIIANLTNYTSVNHRVKHDCYRPITRGSSCWCWQLTLRSCTCSCRLCRGICRLNTRVCGCYGSLCLQCSINQQIHKSLGRLAWQQEGHKIR